MRVTFVVVASSARPVTVTEVVLASEPVMTLAMRMVADELPPVRDWKFQTGKVAGGEDGIVLAAMVEPFTEAWYEKELSAPIMTTSVSPAVTAEERVGVVTEAPRVPEAVTVP